MARHTNMIMKWGQGGYYPKEDSDSSRGDKNPQNDRGEKAPPNERLEELKKSDFRILEDQPDVIGWDVIESAGKKVGIVRDLLFEREELKIRYLVVDLKEGEVLEEDKSILIPIGRAHLFKNKRKIEILGLGKEQLSAIPVYKNTKSLARVDEEKTQQIVSGISTKPGEDKNFSSKDFYSHRDFDEGSFYDPTIGNEKDKN